MAVARLSLTNIADGEVRLSDEVELYQRTYTTLLRSSGETHLRILESSHRAMGSSLHPLAGSDELDLGAFIYAIRRLPDGIVGAELVVMGQDVEDLIANGIPVEEWAEAEAPARRRRWYDSGTGTLAVLMASASDVDDLVPTLVAFQIEWNKIRRQAAGRLACRRDDRVPAEVLSRELGGSAEDWNRLREAWGELFGERMRLIEDQRLSLRVRMLGGTNTGYSRLTRRWWAPVSAELDRGLDRASAVLRLLQHPQPRQHRHRDRARARAGAGRVRRGDGRGRHPLPGAERVPRGQDARARGTTSCTSSRGCTSAPGARRAAPSGAPPSSRRASRTCAARRRCGCPRR